MPIPAVTSQDAFLRALLDEQVSQGIQERIAVEDVLRGLPVDTHKETPPFSLPGSVRCDIEHLERLCLVEFFPDNPHVRLTATGIYTALLFEKVRREGQPTEAAHRL